MPRSAARFVHERFAPQTPARRRVQRPALPVAHPARQAVPVRHRGPRGSGERGGQIQRRSGRGRGVVRLGTSFGFLFLTWSTDSSMLADHPRLCGQTQLVSPLLGASGMREYLVCLAKVLLGHVQFLLQRGTHPFLGPIPPARGRPRRLGRPWLPRPHRRQRRPGDRHRLQGHPRPQARPRREAGQPGPGRRTRSRRTRLRAPEDLAHPHPNSAPSPLAPPNFCALSWSSRTASSQAGR